MKNKILICIATLLLSVLLILINCQHNQLERYRELLELVDTTHKTDTLFMETTVIDTVPKVVQTTLVRRDTLWKDSIPYQLTLKKKITLIQ